MAPATESSFMMTRMITDTILFTPGHLLWQVEVVGIARPTQDAERDL
jgi:hypothetical protein